jgi:hypothetical protein
MTTITDYPIQNSKAMYCQASSIGSKACDLVHSQDNGTIFGVSSRGIFIRTHSRWLIFISSERFPGPLTINIDDIQDVMRILAPGDQVDIASGDLSLGDNLVVSTRHLAAWQPEPPYGEGEALEVIQERLVKASELATSSGISTGLSVLLPILASREGDAPRVVENLPRRIEAIYNQLIGSKGILMGEEIIDLLGAGQGLTPSGDDFTIGYLLALNRWGHQISSPANLSAINQAIVSAAYQKTTTLSANLIECATLGLADQRLISALDWLVAGSGHDARVIEELLSWGSSSGGDVLVGFAAALVPIISVH